MIGAYKSEVCVTRRYKIMVEDRDDFIKDIKEFYPGWRLYIEGHNKKIIWYYLEKVIV